MDTTYSDKRKYTRFAVNALGTIIRISRGLRIGKTISCNIIDISEGGAYIDAQSPVTDTEFYLGRNTEPGHLRLCSVVRRVFKDKMGVQFVVAAGAGKYK